MKKVSLRNFKRPVKKTKRELKGQVTGKIKGTKLTMIRYSHHDEDGRRVNLYECECGNFKKIRADQVTGRRYTTKSCGCVLASMKTPEFMAKLRATPGRVEKLSKAMKGKPNPRKGMVRIEDPIGSGKYRFITEKELDDMFYGWDALEALDKVSA